MEIKIVKSRRDFSDFVMLPWKIYRKDPVWVPPLISDVKFVLDKKKNPFWKHAEQKLFLVKKKRKVMGRIAAIIDRDYNQAHKEKVGFFGFFECFNNYEVAELLLSTAKMYLHENGMEIIRGPMNPTIYEECGTLISGFDTQPYVMMTHNPPYYPQFLNRFGLVKAVDWYAYLAEVLPEPPKMVTISAKYAAEHYPQVKVRAMNMENYDQEVQKIREVFNTAWNKNWGHVPFSDEEMNSLAKRLKPLAVPELAYFAEIDGKPIGVLIGIPNFNEVLKHLNGRLFPFGWIKALYYARKIKTARLIIMGVLEEYRKMGVEALMYVAAHKAGYRLGYKWVEASMILEQNNPTRKAAEAFDSKPYKIYRIYEMRI